LCTYGHGEYSLYWGASQQLLDQGVEDGCQAVTFTVPRAPRGKHKVTLKIEGLTYDADFKILPSISLSDEDGTVGSKLTVTGEGFNANEKGIEVQFGEDVIETGIEADSSGSWQYTFEIPPSNSGEHFITASGVTPADEVQAAIFMVTPQIEINPDSGGVGTMVAIDGTGFGNAETGITVTYDSLAVKTDIASDTNGSWQSSFFIPSSTRGRHTITAYGDTTAEAGVNEVIFSVSPEISLELASGQLGDSIHAGDSIWVSGIGFEKNEAEIKIIFDDTVLASKIIADAKGSWAVMVTVPQSTRGKHRVTSSGESTRADEIASAALTISPQIKINRTSAAIGDEVEITGTGFGEKAQLTVDFSETEVAPDSTTDTDGNFTVNFKVPKLESGTYTITVMEGVESIFAFKFNIESIPPPIPGLISPKPDSRMGLMGRTVVTFDWADVDDPSGVVYALEVSLYADFSEILLGMDNLSETSYTLTEDEALEKGEYYWRVKAIDGAGNESKWSTGLKFRVGLIDWWLIPVIIIVILVIAAVTWRINRITRRDGWK